MTASIYRNMHTHPIDNITPITLVPKSQTTSYLTPHTQI